MSYDKKFKNWKELVTEAANSSSSATEAAAKLGIKYDTYRKYAIQYNCFSTNSSGKGLSKRNGNTIPLEEIIEGKHPQYQSNKLRIRLINEEYFEPKCNTCGLTEWLGNPIPLELEHIDGNNSNHLLKNLELLCPNCHSLTSTYRGRNKKHKVL